ncbi:gamma-glutamyltransferase [Robbsia sp. Bb-Pol-6]|uniref:Glutathione hydrolase proenzyme n=1 Tax=Robbsia betulipollinis TaxID=2981849 RepID=A0ABT3ZM97_9BURK|nr:gamma-glutamyltransferase [Robbsia betulipollinis]MCY0387674.1 gamma-glutamyltransferase [Robbsia betulipollinis]
MILDRLSRSSGVARWCACALLATVTAFAGTAPALAKRAPAPALDSAAVAVADRYSAQAAEQILRAGGNAVDAAVAIAFTLAVTYPEAGNIGGGGFMTLYVDGKPYFLDYRERAPQAATREMYLDNKGKVVPGASLIGGRSAGVPGTVMGMWEAQRRFGKLKWKQVLAPAIAYASDGFEVDEQLQSRRDKAHAEFAGKTNFDAYFSGLNRGATFRQPELAATLTRIADDGATEFYTGQTADLIAEAMRGHGLISKDDLAAYRAVWREPVQADWNGYRVITAPPPSSGGIGLVQMLRMKSDLAPAFEGVPVNSPKYIHLVAEIEKRVFADRAEYLGDPDFYKVPVARLIDPAYLQKRADEISPDHISVTKNIRPGLDVSALGVQSGGNADVAGSMPEKAETTHYSVVDKWGNAVSNTYTINGYFGSGVVVPGAGFLLNDEMDDFAAKPGVANMFGVVGSDANAIAPGKRPLSSMSPTILTRDGKVALVIGTPGGSRIFTSIFQVIENLYGFHMSLDGAVAQMRFHHQLLPENTIFWEPYAPLDGDLAKQVEALGYKLQAQSFNGDIQAIQVEGRTATPMADPRGRGVTLIVK